MLPHSPWLLLVCFCKIVCDYASWYQTIEDVGTTCIVNPENGQFELELFIHGMQPASSGQKWRNFSVINVFASNCHLSLLPDGGAAKSGFFTFIKSGNCYSCHDMTSVSSISLVTLPACLDLQATSKDTRNMKSRIHIEQGGGWFEWKVILTRYSARLQLKELSEVTTL